MREPPSASDTSARPRVLVVDDDERLLATLGRFLEREGYTVEAYSSALAFLRAARVTPPVCVLLDVDMPEMDGVAVQAALLSRTERPIPIVFMTGHVDDVRLSVKAMKAGAIDYLLKPFQNREVLEAIASALRVGEREEARRRAQAEARRTLGTLTPREREVCDLVADGMTSKAIAARLGTSERTITTHRSRILTKLGARSLSDVVRLVDLSKGRRRD